MARLIPLVLNPSFETVAKRFSAVPPSAPPTFKPPPTPIRPSRKRPGPVTDLTIVPYTPQEWRKVMAEVKALYEKRQYKQCSARCKQLLENIRDPYKVHPLYSIYLSFFAANSLELTARALHNNSSHKLPLFQESLSLYEKAESYMQFAAFATNPTFLQATSSTLGHRSTASISSIRSSVDSIFSQVSCSSATSSILDSPSSPRPTSIIYRPQPMRVKKKVSFSSQVPMTVTTSDEEVSDSELLYRFPSPPSRDSLVEPSRPTSTSTSPTPAHTLALTRYHTHLTSLTTQLAYHTSSIRAQIHTLSLIRRARRSNLPDLFSSSSTLDIEKESMRKMDLQERIRKGREDGWPRKRFEAGRYKVLCEKAMGDIEGGMF